jgi:hypothetical protein
VYTDDAGVVARVSRDGARTLGAPVRVLTGARPGRVEPSCPLVQVVGPRQRVNTMPRAVYDRRGRLHVVATMGSVVPGANVSGAARVLHAVADGSGFTAHEVDDEPGQQFAAAVTALEDTSVVVTYLNLDSTGTSMTSRAVRIRAGNRTDEPVPLSDEPSLIPNAAEAASYVPCYGLGDYTTAVASGRTVTAVWGSAERATRPAGDTDVLLRTVHFP